MICPFCKNENFDLTFKYSAPPKAEVHFKFSSQSKYEREVFKCTCCGHYLSCHSMNTSQLYSDDYVSSNYKDLEGIKKTFERIIALPETKSDNFWRVKRVVDFGKKYFSELGREANQAVTVLDIGSGLGVFPYGISKAGWSCTALDPDARSVEHIKSAVKIAAICANFMEFTSQAKFDCVTLNKVLEHVENPEEMLRKVHDNIHPKSFVYVELPDGEVASQHGSDREEFTIDHLHVFSMTSACLLSARAGFEVVSASRIVEPSTKYSLCLFLRPH